MHKFSFYFEVCLRQNLLKKSGSKPVQTLFILLGINLNTDILFLGGKKLEKSFCVYLLPNNFTPNQQEGLWA